MTNTEIIAAELKARGLSAAALKAQQAANGGDLPYHTVAVWARLGYHVKAGEKPLFSCGLWKSAGGRFCKKIAYIYGPDQVEKNVDAPDLATIQARLGSVPGLDITVHGAQTAAPVVWLTGDTNAAADEIAALGGIWSNKKQAFYIHPGNAPTAAAPAKKTSRRKKAAAPELENLKIAGF